MRICRERERDKKERERESERERERERESNTDFIVGEQQSNYLNSTEILQTGHFLSSHVKI